MNHIIDSIPVPICQNRINRSKITKGKQYKRLHNKYAKLFYIIIFHSVTKEKRHTNCISFYRRKNGRCESLRVRFRDSSTRGKTLWDSAYTDYQIEDYLLKNKFVE